MTTVAAPFSYAGTYGDLGFSYTFAAEAIRLAMADALDLTAIPGLVPLVGDFAGTGSDVLRITHMGNVGYQLPFAALASETDTITPSTLTTGYSTVSLGVYGLGHSETYKQQITSRQREVLIDSLKGFIPNSWKATLRASVCTTGAAFSTAIGATTTDLSIDDLLDFNAAFRSQRGARKPNVILAPQQVNQALESARNEPAFQESISEFSAVQGFDESSVLQNFLGLGWNAYITSDVTQASSAYQGFGYSPGGIGWAVASTLGVKVANPQGAILVPEYGLVIEEIVSGSGQATRKYEARSFFGVGAGDSTVFMQRRLISKV